MNALLYLPGDEIIDQTLAEFMGYFWCRYMGGVVHGERIVRFLMSPEDFAASNEKFGVGGIVLAKGEEPPEQLAFKPVPPYHSSRDEMAAVEEKLYRTGQWEIYLKHLRSVLDLPVAGPISPEHLWTLLTASAKYRSKAAYLHVDAQRPRQQMLLG